MRMIMVIMVMIMFMMIVFMMILFMMIVLNNFDSKSYGLYRNIIVAV